MKNLILLLIFLFSIQINAQINRNHHNSYSENIIQSLKLEDGKMLLLFSEERSTYCPWPTLALFDATGEIIWKNRLETNNQGINFFNDKTTFFSFDPSTQQIFIASTDVDCCTDVPMAPKDVIALLINAETGEKLMNFEFENLYSFESSYENINRTVRINAETFIIANSNSSIEGVSVFSFNPITSEGTFLKEIPNETITFIHPVDEETFIFNTSNTVYKMNISGIIEDSLILTENLELRHLYPDNIEILNDNRYIIIDENLNILEDHLLGDTTFHLVDVALNGEWAYVLTYIGNDTNEIDEVKLFKKNIDTQEEIEIVFSPENFQPDRFILEQGRIQMFGTEFHSKSFGLTVVDADAETLNYEILQGKDLALTDVNFEIVSMVPRNGIPHFDVTYNISVKVQNLGSPVDSFNINFHSYAMLMFYNSLCGNLGGSKKIYLHLETGETSDYIFFGTGSMTSIPNEPNQFGISGCAWVSAPDGKTDDVAENDMICKTELVTSVQHLQAKTFKTYPNPTRDFIFIEGDFISENLQYIIFNAQGKQIDSGSLNGQNSINVQHLKSGFYAVQLFDNKTQFQMIKVVKN